MGKNGNSQYYGNGKNRAGLQPVQQSKPFEIRTSQVKDYLQKKVNTLYATAGKGEAPTINMYTTEISRKFYPFIIVLGTDCMKSYENDDDTKIDTFFQTNTDETYVDLDEVLFNLFRNYTYNKSDQEAFFSDVFRREMGITKSSSVLLKSLRAPKLMTVNGGRDQVITFMIDPIRVFHDMLTEEDDKREFLVHVKDIKKINIGEYRYLLKREIKSGKNKGPKSNNFIHELEGKIKGQMRK